MPATSPIYLSPANPHYFLYADRTRALIGSSEHYGVLLNPDFNLLPYLDTLARDGLNLVRVFSGAYREYPGAFSIPGNTLAPEDHRFLAPWRRLPDGRWDLNHFDPAYLARLHTLLAAARERDIIVEFTFFSPFYEEKLWTINPFHPNCNVNGAGLDPTGHPVPANRAFSLAFPSLLAHQEALVRHVVRALNPYPNLYYEIMNEPYWVCPDLPERDAWQARIATVIADTESTLPHRHLVSQNIHNHAALVPARIPNVDILNFHYAHPAAALANWHLNRPIADNETGFLGTDPLPYRQEAWLFLLSGGSAFTHLDLSFTPAAPTGATSPPPGSPSSGGPALRAQLAALKRLLDSLDLAAARPTPELVGRPNLPLDIPAVALTLSPREALFYLARPTTAVLSIAPPTPAPHVATWLDPATTTVIRTEPANPTPLGAWYVTPPTYAEDIACRLQRVEA